MRRIWKAASGEPQKTATSRAGEADPQTDLDRLIELRGILRRAMDDAPPGAVSGLSREYRETCKQIAQMEGGDHADPAARALDTIAESIASFMHPA